MDHSRADFDYFSRRAAEEQAAADRASDPRARQSHRDLAERYADAARAIAGGAKAGLPDQAPAAPVPLLQPEFRILP